MKCNKCLKIIPKGEEIRFSSHDSSYRGDGGGYSGCYCEDCWKKSYLYKKHEDRGKKSNSDGIPNWGYFMLGVLVGGIVVGLIIWLFKRDDE